MFQIKSFANAVLKSVSLPELVIVVFHFVPLLKVEEVVRKKVVMILWPDSFLLVLPLHLFVWVKESCLVLSQFVIIVLIVKVVGGKVPTLRLWIPEFLHHPLKSCICLICLKLGVGRRCIDVQKLNLFSYMVHCSLKVAVFSICGETKRLKR